MATAVASVVLAGAVGLLGASARAVSDSELETTAIWLVTRTVEEWRSSMAMADADARGFDREGRVVETGRLFVVRWAARPAPDAGARWWLSVTATSPRLRDAVAVEVLVSREGS